MTGAYFRVKRNGKFEIIEIEHLTDEERSNLMKDRDPEFVLSCLNLTCKKIQENAEIFNELVEDGILKVGEK